MRRLRVRRDGQGPRRRHLHARGPAGPRRHRLAQARLDAGRAPSRRVRGDLERVVQRLEAHTRAPARSAGRPATRSSAAAGRGGRCRSRCPRRTPSWPSRPLLPCPARTRPSGRSSGPEVGAAAVVLEARDDPRAGAQVGLDRAVADQARAVLAHGAQVHEPDARERALAHLVALARAVGSRRRQPGPPPRGRRRRAAPRAWWPPCPRPRPPGPDPGRRRCRRGRAPPGPGSRRCWQAPARSPCRAIRSGRAAPRCFRGRRRCSSARDRGRTRAGSGSWRRLEHDHGAAHVVVRGGHTTSGEDQPPRSRGLGLELRCGQPVEADGERLLGELAGG